ncbi:MAG: methyltransferase regulatory domain-containing protein [Alphaproteobacteria bacterium]|nr:methyltransferase regulatory domain-containing protein [Alphaproteobacteria bacterium]MCB9695662.1 methyltransferase regulatory domain-containing protein [Alphaproteobacteria bacterium]
MNDYDRVPYRSHPYLLAHPDHLAAIATLHGLEPVPIDRARILEIGCSSGGHLLPMAASLPDATFVGVDPVTSAIELGRTRVADLGLRNVELLDMGIEALPSGEPFDYVVAHGVLSWVPPAVRDGLWAALGERLSERGIAYLSFNAYPGWAMRGALCHMMRWHVRDLEEPLARVAGARELLDVLCDSTAPTTEWGAMLHAERKRVAGLEDWYLLHDHLSEHNHPFWFHEVDATAHAHGLRFLAEAEPWRGGTMALSEPGRSRLPAMASSQEELEQYLDMARMAVFRETLWVRDTAPVQAALRPERLRDLSFTMRARRLDEDGTRYRTPEGTVITATDPLARALLGALGDGARSWSFGVLSQRVRGVIGELDDDQLAANLLALVVGYGVVRLHRWPRPSLGTLTERPVAFTSARAQAAAGEVRVTNLGHEGIPTDDFDRAVLARLDGAHDREALTSALIALVDRGELGVDLERERMSDDPVTAAVERRMIETLIRVARSGLLVG